MGLGKMHYNFSTPIGLSVYFTATLLSVIVMLNILISVVSDVFDAFTMQRARLDTKTKSALLYDLGSLG